MASVSSREANGYAFGSLLYPCTARRPVLTKSASIKYAVRGEGAENEPARQPGRFDEPRGLRGRPPRREHLLLRPRRRRGASRARPRRVRPVLPVAEPVPPLVRPLRRQERSLRRGPGRPPGARRAPDLPAA